MPTGATGQLGLALPVQGELSGTWGDTVNNGITQYTNIAIAGTLSFAGDGAITLANTTGDATASNIGSTTAQYMVIRVTGTLTTPKIITAPSYSKLYLVDNAATGSTVTFKASGQTGVSVAVGESAFVYYNGTDYIKVASDLITALTGTLGVANGGTGLTTLTANNVILGNGTSTPLFVAPGTNGNILTSNGTTWTSTAPAAGGVTTFSAGTTGFTPSTATSGAVTLAGTLNVANGGTGLTSLTTGYIPFGAGTSAFGNSADLFWDNTNARLGVGTNSPTQKIHISNASGGASLLVANGLNSASNIYVGTDGFAATVGSIYTNGVAPLAFGTNSIERGRFDTSGNFIVGGTTAINSKAGRGNITINGSSAAILNFGVGSAEKSYIYYNGTELDIFNVSNNAIKFGTNATLRFQIGSAGQWGIGGATYGTAGQVFTSGGSGAAPTWSTVGGSAMVFLASFNAAGASTVDVDNAFDSTYQTYLIMYNNCSPVNNNASLFSRLKISGTYNTGSNYRYLMFRPASNSGEAAFSNGTAETSIIVTSGQSFNTNDTASGSYYVFRPFAGKNQSIYHQGTYFNGGDNQVNATTAGAINVTGACTGVRFFYSSGNFATGTFYLYGIKAT
jgi:hypothetical protein